MLCLVRLLLGLQSTAGSLQSLCWASSAVGGIASAYFSGSLVQQYGTHTVFALTAIFPLIVSASALLIDEQRVVGSAAAQGFGVVLDGSSSAAAAAAAEEGRSSRSSSSRGLGLSRSSGVRAQAVRLLGEGVVHQAGALWSAVKQRHILLPTVFVFLWQVSCKAFGEGLCLGAAGVQALRLGLGMSCTQRMQCYQCTYCFTVLFYWTDMLFVFQQATPSCAGR